MCFLPLPVSMQSVYAGEEHSGVRSSVAEEVTSSVASEEADWCTIVCHPFTAGYTSPCRFSFICYAKVSKGSKISPCVAVGRWCRIGREQTSRD